MLDSVSFAADPSSFSTDKHMGNGFFATVFDGVIPGTVVKTSNETHDAWLFWAGLCMSRSRLPVYMPKIYFLHIDFEQGKYWALMEKLNKYTDDDKHRRMCGTSFTRPWRAKKDEVTKFHYNHLRVSFAKINAMCGAEAFAQFDAHRYNWMKRDNGEEVCTDPFAFTRRDADLMKFLSIVAPKTGGRLTWVGSPPAPEVEVEWKEFL